MVKEVLKHIPHTIQALKDMQRFFSLCFEKGAHPFTHKLFFVSPRLSSWASTQHMCIYACVCVCNYYVLLLARHFAFTSEYISMAQARNILGFGRYQAHTHNEGHKGRRHGVCFRERKRGCE
jgi:hypothetical protein